MTPALQRFALSLTVFFAAFGVSSACSKNENAPGSPTTAPIAPMTAPLEGRGATSDTASALAHKVTEQTGSKHSSAQFEVSLLPPAAPVQAEAPGAVTLHLVAREGFHINAEYPLNFRPDGSSPDVVFDGERIDLRETGARTACKDHAEESCELRTQVPFRAQAAGEKRVGGVVSFSVCNPQRCLIEKKPLAVAVTVSPP